MKNLKTILVIDDNHETLDLLELFLYKDYNLITGLNGFEALAQVEELLPDLIITDIMMPVMDGIKFLNSFRKNAKLAKIPVIAMTSFSKDHTVKSLLNIGFADVIGKPLTQDVLSKAVDAILKKPSKKQVRTA